MTEWRKVKKIFDAALLEAKDNRPGFLDDACGSDVDLRREVESLLASHDEAGSLLETPAFVDTSLSESGLSSGDSFSHYKILEKIGEGGMGEVFLGLDTSLKRKIALKLLPPGLSEDEERLGRFEQEAFAASSLNHPNIVTIHEFSRTEEGRTYIATEYVEGESLSDRIASGEMTLKENLEIARQIASALAAAHKAGVIHRDIKPDNIIVRPDGHVKLLDFGVAKLTGDWQLRETVLHAGKGVKTASGTVIGTAPYMSPEQIRALEIDARTDIWSFGVVLYQMLTGQRPFDGDTHGDTLASILTTDPEPISDVPEEVQDVVLKMLEKDRELRFKSATDLEAVLVDVVQGRFKTNDSRGGKSARDVPSPRGPNSRWLSLGSSRSWGPRLSKHSRFTLSAAIGIPMAVLFSISIYWGFFQTSDPVPAVRTVAIIPFENDTGDSALDYVADGLTDSVADNLSRLPELSVKSRSSTVRLKDEGLELKDLGDRLSVDAILMGKIAKTGEVLNLSVELVDPRTENIFWAKHFDKRLSDLADFQLEIADELVASFKFNLSSEEEAGVTRLGTSSNEAYQAYLMGRFLMKNRTDTGLQDAIRWFKKAAEIDPEYANPWSGLSDAYQMQAANTYRRRETSSNNEADRLMSLAVSAGETAVELDPKSAEALTSLAKLKGDYEWDFAESERLFKRAIEADPNYLTARQWYSILLTKLGRHERAVAEMRAALKIDPISRIVNNNLITSLVYAGRLDESIVQANKAIELHPEFATNFFALSLTYEFKMDYQNAYRNFIIGARRSESRSSEFIAKAEEQYRKGGWKAFDDFRLRDLLSRDGKFSRTRIAAEYAKRRNRQKTFEYLRLAYQERDPTITFIASALEMEHLRDDPEFISLVKKIGLR